jgi:hypothetical protein
MSFLFGGVRRREDPELTVTDRRNRQHLARDINDTRALAGSDAAPRRNRHWVVLAIAAAALGGLAVATGNRGGQDVPITAHCTTPAIAVASSRIDAGVPLHYRLTGADGVRYVVTLDGRPVRGEADVATPYTQTPAGPALELQQCVSPTLTVPAPSGGGGHQLAMLAVADDGTTRQVTAVTVTVTR